MDRLTYLTRTHLPAPLAASLPVQRAVPRRARAALAVAVGLAIIIAHLLGQGDASARAVAADPELAQLLRGMAILKAGLTVGAVSLVAWRLGYPAGLRLTAGLIAAAALMAAGPVLIWHVAPIGAAALLFHVGTALLLILCLFDRSGAQRLRASAAGRRTARRTAR